MITFLEVIKTILAFFVNHVWVWNMVFAVVIVFFERRNPKSVWAWLLLLYFLPFIGFLFYLLLGQDMHKRRIFRMKEVEDLLNNEIRKQETAIKSRELERKDINIEGFSDLILYNLENTNAALTGDNDIDVFVDGQDKFEALLQDIKEAKRFIHIQYYIIKNDVLFAGIVEELEKKVKQGVQVRILFDSMGSRLVKNKYWKELNQKGIQTAEFFPALFGRFQLRVNYRNHRKIVVIDNKVAYVGGFNIGKEYVDLDPKFGHWRDTHMRVKGSAVGGLQLRFLMDWNYAAKENLFQQADMFEGLEPGVRDRCEIQIISSGPDQTSMQIHDNYLRLINKAQKSIYIQTPYFIPDETIMSALMIAVKSGIEVNIMIPCMPDHPFVYWATYSYVGDLVMAGAKCYTYEGGFLHSKGMIIDGKAFCYGTANMDIRSFSLNFEVNMLVYHKEKAEEMEQIFKKDLEFCKQITQEEYASRGLWLRFKEQACRLLSPVL